MVLGQEKANTYDIQGSNERPILVLCRSISTSLPLRQVLSFSSQSFPDAASSSICLLRMGSLESPATRYSNPPPYRDSVMASTQDAEGLQVDYDRQGASAPEAYNPHQYTAVSSKDGPYNAGDQASTPHQRAPFGLSILSFGLLVALVTAVIVGGAVGGGLGGALANCKG